MIAGITTFAGTYDITGATNIFGTADFTGIVESVGNTVTIEFGTAIFETANSPLTLNAVLLLANSGTLSVETGVVRLLGGGTVEDGLITVAAGTELDLTGVLMDSTAAVTNAGTLNVTDSFINSSGQWTNAAGGVMNFTGTRLGLLTAFDNAGAVTAQTDVLRGTELLLEGGGTTSGSFDIGLGAELDLYGTQTFTAASTILGAGTVEVISGVTTFAGTYDITDAAHEHLRNRRLYGDRRVRGEYGHDRIWNGHFRDGEQSADVERGFAARQLRHALCRDGCRSTSGRGHRGATV